MSKRKFTAPGRCGAPGIAQLRDLHRRRPDARLELLTVAFAAARDAKGSAQAGCGQSEGRTATSKVVYECREVGSLHLAGDIFENAKKRADSARAIHP